MNGCKLHEIVTSRWKYDCSRNLKKLIMIYVRVWVFARRCRRCSKRALDGWITVEPAEKNVLRTSHLIRMRRHSRKYPLVDQRGRKDIATQSPWGWIEDTNARMHRQQGRNKISRSAQSCGFVTNRIAYASTVPVNLPRRKRQNTQNIDGINSSRICRPEPIPNSVAIAKR
jgi:hypothetical protein